MTWSFHAYLAEAPVSRLQLARKLTGSDAGFVSNALCTQSATGGTTPDPVPPPLSSLTCGWLRRIMGGRKWKRTAASNVVMLPSCIYGAVSATIAQRGVKNIPS
jgi:hypothetical protein